MKTNKVLNQAIHEVVDNQMRDRNPPETKETYDRLIGEGYSDKEARNLIGYVVVSEIFDVLTQGMPYNAERFTKALKRLPELPKE